MALGAILSLGGLCIEDVVRHVLLDVVNAIGLCSITLKVLHEGDE